MFLGIDLLAAPPERVHAAAMQRTRDRIAALKSESDARLAELAAQLRASVNLPKRDPHFVADAIALMAEAVRRTRKLAAYDVQLLAGHILAHGGLAEMATGEGKTLVALFPSFVFSLHGRGAHVATVNPYLAARDCEFAQPAFELLGTSVGLLRERDSDEKKRVAYAADVTYGVGTEFGFDYLRDQLSIRRVLAARNGQSAPLFHEILLGRQPLKPETVQRGHAFAVIDEADSVLIDEARSPLILSAMQPGPSRTPEVYLEAKAIAERLTAPEHFVVRPGGIVELTDAGRHTAFELLPDSVLAQLRRNWPHTVQTALRARLFFRRDVHFVVQDDKVVIVDENTGRLCPDRTWRDGLHQAVEAAAGVTITEENSSEATITRPGYFRLYERICGMTGTAREAASELRQTYRITTSIVPLHRPSQRAILADRVFTTRATKLDAVVSDIAARHAKNQPVLIGTRTIETSEALAEKLLARGFFFALLNAKQDEEEAHIIESAGQPGRITIATNMAGRGAHIPVPEESQRAGGLHVIGLERHDSARIDRQLVGRCARQGEPGSAQFFLSLEDDLLVRHAPAVAARLAKTAADSAGELPANFAAHFLRTQRRVESADRAARRALARHDEWINELKETL